MKVNYEHTDTFGGEANYCWVNRGTIELPDSTNDLKIVRAVKAKLQMSGVKCNKLSWGQSQDMIVLRPRGIHQIIFITFGEF